MLVVVSPTTARVEGETRFQSEHCRIGVPHNPTVLMSLTCWYASDPHTTYQQAMHSYTRSTPAHRSCALDLLSDQEPHQDPAVCAEGSPHCVRASIVRASIVYNKRHTREHPTPIATAQCSFPPCTMDVRIGEVPHMHALFLVTFLVGLQYVELDTDGGEHL